LILAPKPTVTDAAHRNGVPVLGTIFFPPAVYGGKIQWVRDLVQKQGESFPVADKLIAAASYYGFDGWFVNQETVGADPELVALVQEFLRYLKNRSRLRIMWYDAMNKEGSVGWQGGLNERNSLFFQDGGRISDDLFVDFRWRPERLTASRVEVLRLSRSPYDLYAGVDVEGAGYNKNVLWDSLFPENQPHTVSIGFYRPEWTFNNSRTAEEFYQKEARFWIGSSGDPGNTRTTESWKGIAHYIPEQSPITTLPFVTNFSTGQGHLFAVNGTVVGQKDWNNLSLQDILPTWRWRMESSGEKLRAEFGWRDAYYGGTSLKISGPLITPNPLKLFSTRLKIESKTHLRIAFKTAGPTPTHMNVGLAFSDGPERFEYLDVGRANGGDWNVVTLPLSKYADRTLSVISLRFSSDVPVADYSIKIGQIAVIEAMASPTPPKNLRIVRQWNRPGHAAVRLQWTPSAGKVHSYNVFRKKPDGELIHLGSTPNTVLFVGDVAQLGTEDAAVLIVEAVNASMVRSRPAATRLSWPKP
jgi:mannosyl-glycoprotein endo-beta-N-acetylglucosaminidase